jgi:hypothetical protein
VTLAINDAPELAELLRFLSERAGREDDWLRCSLTDYVGHPANGIPELRNDLNRFVFHLGGDDEGRFLTGPAFSQALAGR